MEENIKNKNPKKNPISTLVLSSNLNTGGHIITEMSLQLYLTDGSQKKIPIPNLLRIC